MYLVLLARVMMHLLCRKPASATTFCDVCGASLCNKGHSGYLNITIFCSYIWIIQCFEFFHILYKVVVKGNTVNAVYGHNCALQGVSCTGQSDMHRVLH